MKKIAHTVNRLCDPKFVDKNTGENWPSVDKNQIKTSYSVNFYDDDDDIQKKKKNEIKRKIMR